MQGKAVRQECTTLRDIVGGATGSTASADQCEHRPAEIAEQPRESQSDGLNIFPAFLGTSPLIHIANTRVRAMSDPAHADDTIAIAGDGHDAHASLAFKLSPYRYGPGSPPAKPVDVEKSTDDR